MKYLITLALVVGLTGCYAPSPTYGIDQTQRQQLFKDCMAALPAGPVSTRYNDWDEVVKACDSIAHYQSKYCVKNCEGAMLPAKDLNSSQIDTIP